MITVNVRVYAALNHYIDDQIKHQWFKVDIPIGSDIIGLIDKIKMPREEIALYKVNSRIENYKYILQEKDDVEIYPRISGG